jgi:hypothetical protein
MAGNWQQLLSIEATKEPQQLSIRITCYVTADNHMSSWQDVYSGLICGKVSRLGSLAFLV